MIDKAKQYKRQRDWERQNYDRVALNIPKGLKAEWQKRATAEGISLTEYIQRAVQVFEPEKHSGHKW